MDFISFDELIIIVVIALLVLGPARTFKLMFSVGQIFAKAKNYLNYVKTELKLEELRKDVSTLKENDFHDVVNRLSPVPSKTGSSGKRQWTVTADDFKENNSSEQSSAPQEHKSEDLKSKDSNADLLLRIEGLNRK